MRYIVESTHSFSDPATGDREYFSANNAWMNAACDYSSTDAGPTVDETMREDINRIVGKAHQSAIGSVTLSTGEVITVSEVITEVRLSKFEDGPFENGNGTYRMYP